MISLIVFYVFVALMVAMTTTKSPIEDYAFRIFAWPLVLVRLLYQGAKNFFIGGRK